jgi:type IV secretory pathway component VirB8
VTRKFGAAPLDQRPSQLRPTALGPVQPPQVARRAKDHGQHSEDHALARRARRPQSAVASGEMSGKLEQMLERAARLETQALERRLAVFLTLLEPVMILVMGAVVLMIVLAILLPIIEINQLVR